MNPDNEQFPLNRNTFRDSFKRLNRSKNLQELGHNFHHLLNNTLHPSDTAIFFKENAKDIWKLLCPEGKNYFEFTQLLTPDTESKLSHITHPVFKLSIIHYLADSAKIGILLGQKRDNSSYNSFDEIVLDFFLQQLSNAYQFYITRKKEKQLVFELNHSILQLNSLIDTGIEISRLQKSSQLLHLALERVVALTNASKGVLRVKSGNKVVETIFFPSPFKAKKMETTSPFIKSEFRFEKKIYRFNLFEKESRDGYVKFDGTDQLLLDAFSRQVHASLENKYLYDQSLEKERIDHEISIAGTIQKRLIPENLPDIKGYDLYGINIPTKSIGGDYYDCIPLKDGRFMFIMADVSGKGIAASLLVSTLHASIHAYVDGPFILEALVQQLNRIIYDAATIDKYLTAVFSVLDPEKNELVAVNAGHNPTYILRHDKTLTEITTGGIPLGMVREAFPYESSKLVLNPGDRIFFYTDGVTEAMNEREEEYNNIKPITNFLTASTAANAKIFIDDLMDDIDNFTGSTPQSDDITALIVMKNLS